MLYYPQTMARLDALPHQSIIDGFKGVIDFYVHRGIPCARKWPRKPKHPKTPEQQQTWDEFTYIMRMWSQLPPEVKEAYEFLALGNNWRPQDYMVRAYIHGLDY